MIILVSNNFYTSLSNSEQLLMWRKVFCIDLLWNFQKGLARYRWFSETFPGGMNKSGSGAPVAFEKYGSKVFALFIKVCASSLSPEWDLYLDCTPRAYASIGWTGLESIYLVMAALPDFILFLSLIHI